MFLLHASTCNRVPYSLRQALPDGVVGVLLASVCVYVLTVLCAVSRRRVLDTSGVVSSVVLADKRQNSGAGRASLVATVANILGT